MVPGWFRAFRLELVSNDKIILCDSPTASYGSGMVPGWFRTLRLPLVSNSKITLRETSMASDGSGVAPCDSPGAFSNDQVALRDCPPLPMSPGWLRGGSTRFASGLSAREKSHFRRRPRLPPTPAATLGPARGSADARVMPRRSGPKRLGCKRCKVALTTLSPQPGLRSCFSPPAGEVSFHTRHGLLLHRRRRLGARLHDRRDAWLVAARLLRHHR